MVHILLHSVSAVFSIHTEVAEYSSTLRAIFEAQYGDLTTQLQFKPVVVASPSIQTLPIALGKNHLDTSDSEVNNNRNVWHF